MYINGSIIMLILAWIHSFQSEFDKGLDSTGKTHAMLKAIFYLLVGICLKI